MTLSQYNKVLVAVVGLAVTYLTIHYSNTSWLPTVTMILTAAGVYQAKNEPPQV